MSDSLMKLSRVVAAKNLVVTSRRVAQINTGDFGLLAEQSRAGQRIKTIPLKTIESNGLGAENHQMAMVELPPYHWKTIESNGQLVKK